MLNRSTLFMLVLLCLLLCAIPVGIFIYHLGSGSFSNNVDDWSAFGGYLSGTVGPVLNFAQFLTTGFIAYLLAVRNSFDERVVRVDELLQEFIVIVEPLFITPSASKTNSLYETTSLRLMFYERNNRAVLKGFMPMVSYKRMVALCVVGTSRNLDNAETSEMETIYDEISTAFFTKLHRSTNTKLPMQRG